MYYYYKIENLINHNRYIGITTDPMVRKNRHFNYLRKNKHFNPHLQLAFNKYGEQNFVFEILENKIFNNPEEAYEYEAYLIRKYDSYNNGYNCNPGGLWTGPKGNFTKEQVFYIKSAFLFEDKCGGVLSKIFNCPSATLHNIKINRNYKPWCEEFNNKTLEEKVQIYEDFCAITKFPILVKAKNSKQSNRNLTKEQVFFILINEEKKMMSWTEIRKMFNNQNRGENYMAVRKGRTYKDYYDEYTRLTEEEKQKVVQLYCEI